MFSFQRVISSLIPISGYFLNPFQPVEQIPGFHGEHNANKMGSIPSNMGNSRLFLMITHPPKKCDYFGGHR